MRKMEQGKNNYQQIVDSIKTKILSGELKIGDKLPTEYELCEIYSVSRASVREAIKFLKALGILDVYQGGGAYITNNLMAQMADSASLIFALTDGKMSELTALRYDFEILAVNLIYKENNSEAMSAFEEFRRRTEKAETPDELKNIDFEIHGFIASSVKNPILKYMHSSIHTLYENNIEFRNTVLSPNWKTEPLEESREYLLSFIDGLLSHDLKEMENAVACHYSSFTGDADDLAYENSQTE